MTVPLTFRALADRLEAADPAPSRKLTRCLTDLTLDVNESDLPLGMLRLARDTDYQLRTEALGLGRLDYQVEAFIFLAALHGPLLPEHDAAAKPWPEALLRALAADVTLSAGVAFIGSGADTLLATCQIGVMPAPWNNLWGVLVRIPVTEKPVITMG